MNPIPVVGLLFVVSGGAVAFGVHSIVEQAEAAAFEKATVQTLEEQYDVDIASSTQVKLEVPGGEPSGDTVYGTALLLLDELPQPVTLVYLDGEFLLLDADDTELPTD